MARQQLKLDKFIARATKKFGNKFNYSLVYYINNTIKIKIICPIHGIYEQRPADHISGKYGCPQCSNEHMNDGRDRRLTLDKLKNRSIEIHGHKFMFDRAVVTNIDTNIIITCKKHGDFLQIPSNHFKGYGCPRCKMSTGELPIEQFLLKHNIEHIYQKKFKECKNPKTNRLLPFDFYLPNYNVCIEFDGQQHFIPYSFNSDKSLETKQSNLEKTQYLDNIKNQYCINNNIRILRIPYYNGGQIPAILSEFLNL